MEAVGGMLLPCSVVVTTLQSLLLGRILVLVSACRNGVAGRERDAWWYD